MADTSWAGRFDPGRLSGLRKKRGLTQNQLAVLVGQSDATIGKYENGRRAPRSSALLRLAEALDADITELLRPGPVDLPVLRARRGLSQTDVAEALGVTQPWYHEIETGEARVAPDQFACLVRLLGADEDTVAKLVVRDDDDAASP